MDRRFLKLQYSFMHVPVIIYGNGIDTTFFGRLFKVKLLYLVIISGITGNR